MLLISLLLHALQQSINAAPLAVSSNGIHFRDDPTCDCSKAPNERSLFNIIWSCLITLFACTWISVHPNIPSLSDSYLTVMGRRIKMMIYALLVPEGVMYWAMRQWLGSRELARRYEDHGWKMVHGHFLQMGGFVIVEPGRRPYTLSPEHLHSLLEQEEITFPTISAEEIEDKSKGDFLAKGLVALQTLWFVTQCIARRKRGLIITELELVTLAFAAFNIITYILWWKKPLDVRYPVHLQLIGQNSVTNEEVDEGAPANSTILQSFLNIPRYILDLLYFNIVDDIREEGVLWALRKRLKLLLVGPFVYARDILHQMTESDESANIPLNATCVPTFYALRMGAAKEYRVDCIMSFFAMIFGAIHCIAWNFPFPSHTERTIWRASSLIIVCIPFPLLCFSFLRLIFIHVSVGITDIDTTHRANVMFILNIIGLILYIPSRIILVFLAFLSLRSLDPKALEDLDWISFLPHIS